MYAYVLALFVTVQSAAAPAQDEIKEGLLRAESLYYEAKFVESIQLLARVNDALAAKPERLQDKIATKLQLALANIGLNDTASAKVFLAELYALDPDYSLDARQYAPKVVALANDARNEQSRLRCDIAFQDARRSLSAGDSGTVLNTLQAMKPKCPNLAELEPDAAELLYRTGLTAYKLNDFPAALNSFRSAVKLSPRHELAAQYVELTESKVQLAGDKLLLQWQKNFDTRDYKAAASDYRQIMAFGENGSPQMVGHVMREYRKALTTLVESWNRACGGDPSTTAQIRNQVSDMLPEPTFATDLQAQMKTCAETSPAPRVTARLDSKTDTVVTAPPRTDASNCHPMESQLALARLKTRVDPEIPQAARAYIQNTQIIVRVKVRIDESGNVAPMEVTGSNVMINNAVRTAVEKWKFNPIADRNGPRCVNTEIPVVIGK
ncbi:MAG TPA: energy transducer TonB [Terriglobia bacterium]|nr:energy transducer TonB [Terriglobia bacterium]